MAIAAALAENAISLSRTAGYSENESIVLA